MANALIYYRTPASSAIITPDPQNLPSGQKIEFIFPDDILEGISEDYKNNIKQIPIANQDGVRKLNLQENGLLDEGFKIYGIFKKEIGSEYSRLKSFRKIKTVDTTHLYGVFGIEIDNAPDFNVDPDSTKGLFIDSTHVGYTGQKNTRYDFSVDFGWGGTIP